jgi:hypothetical protein
MGIASRDEPVEQRSCLRVIALHAHDLGLDPSHEPHARMDLECALGGRARFTQPHGTEVRQCQPIAYRDQARYALADSYDRATEARAVAETASLQTTAETP